MRVLKKPFPGIDMEAVVQDLYKKKQLILDKNGVGLRSMKPYDFDEGLPAHIA